MSGEAPPEEVFADTCVLLNFVHHEWERDYSTPLVSSESVTIVVSETVLDELADVADRRRDIYEDVVDYLIEADSGIEAYDPGDRRTYIGANDAKHVRNLQERLAGLDDRREILRRIRRFVRAAERRVEHIESRLEEHAIDPVPPLELRFAINSVLDHDADTSIVTDAAAWAADGGSGVLVTLDDDDIFQNENRINEVLADEQGPEWVLRITRPESVLADGTATELGE